MVIDLSLRQLNGVLLVRSAQQQKLNAYGQIIRLGPNAIDAKDWLRIVLSRSIGPGKSEQSNPLELPK